MIKLSVNVNKIATLRNSRGGRLPSVLDAVEVCAAAGAHGITVHPRSDERHIRRADVFEIRSWLDRVRQNGHDVEFNIEGDPRPDLIAMVLQVHPTQCTLVPVVPGEMTSQAGWRPGEHEALLRHATKAFRHEGIRVSVFVDPDEAAVRWASQIGADRVELYTEPFARACEAGDGSGPGSFPRYLSAAKVAHELGMGINAGHDLDLENLTVFRSLPHLDEVSIGHALISHALYVGLESAVRDYIGVLAGEEPKSPNPSPKSPLRLSLKRR
jgi:pyridoxine 5-phosphate synthase